MPSYFITGTSRGIGLCMVRELLKDESNFVIASARNPSGSKELQELAAKYPKKQLAIVKFDIDNVESIKAGVAEATALLPNGLDYLIHNAGVNPQALVPFEELDLDLFTQEMRVNTVIPVQVTLPFLPLIRKGTVKKLVFLTSELGSIEIAAALPGLTNAYSTAKAALNMLARKWGSLLKFEGITTILVHPGWVHTEIGDAIDAWMQKNAPQLVSSKLTPEASAQGTLKVIKDAKLEDATSFYNVDGTKKPW